MSRQFPKQYHQLHCTTKMQGNKKSHWLEDKIFKEGFGPQGKTPKHHHTDSEARWRQHHAVGLVSFQLGTTADIKGKITVQLLDS